MPSAAAHAATTAPRSTTIGTASSEFYVTGGAGDLIAGGLTADYTNPTVTASSGVVTATVSGWNLVLAAPTGQALATGTYSGAVLSATATAPGIEISGDGHTCSQDFGTFTVYEVTATSFNATFKQSCSSATGPALVGFIRYNATQTTPVPTLPSSAHPVFSPPNSGTTSANADEFHFVSASGDYIGGGQTVDYTGSAVSMTGNLAGIGLGVGGPEGWSLGLAAPTGEQLVPGTYTGATRFSGTTPGISVTGQSRGCNQDFGTFTIYEITADDTGTLTSLNATFSQACESTNAPLLVGFIRFNATLPTPVPTLPSALNATLAPSSGTATAAGQANVTLDASGTTGDIWNWATSYSFSFGDGAAPVVSATPTVTKPEWQGTYEVTVTVTDGYGRTSTSTAQWLTVGAGYQPVSPTRLLDTRHGIGAPVGAVGGMQSVTLHLPSSVTASGHGPLVAVVLNVTVTQPTSSGDIKVYSSGSVQQPATSNVNFVPGLTVANLVTVPLEPSDVVVLFVQSAGTAQLVADIEGYYTMGNDPTDSGFASSMPVRIVDTRHGIGNVGGRIPGWGHVTLTVPSSVPAGATALAVNVTAVNAASAGYLTVYPDGAGLPKVSNINFGAGQTLPNLTLVQIPADRKIDFYLGSAGSADLVVDLEGYFSPAATAKFVPLYPIRLFDTRQGDAGGALPSGYLIRTSMAYAFGIPVSALTAALYNVTVTQPGANGYVSVFPDGVTSLPTVSNLNFVKNQTVPNAVLAPMTDGKQLFYNGSSAAIQLIADFFGYFAKPLALDAPPTSAVAKRVQRLGAAQVQRLDLAQLK